MLWPIIRTAYVGCMQTYTQKNIRPDACRSALTPYARPTR